MKKRRLNKNAWLLISFLLLVIIVLIILIFNKEDLLMPNFVNKELKEIEEFCKLNECKLNINYEYDLNIQENKIISQSLKENEKLKKNTTIKVVISKGINYQIYKDNNVNELGRVPIMMYHGIENKKDEDTKYIGGNIDKDGYQRTAESFRRDLEFYYENDYRMIRLKDYVDGIIDVEIGKSPIILTFDDGLSNNIKVTGLDASGNIIIDPNSAVGILESFKKKYPDYQVTATFFINGGLFNQKEYNDLIIEWLIKNGYDIGNHTYNHANLNNTTESETIKEVGSMYKLLKSKTSKFVNIVALPFGTPYNSKHDNFNHVLAGEYMNETYLTVATLRVGWESEYSPFHQKFNQQFLKRIRAYDNNGIDFDIEYNFKLLKNSRYISDGNKNTIVIKSDDFNSIKETKLKVISY